MENFNIREWQKGQKQPLRENLDNIDDDFRDAIQLLTDLNKDMRKYPEIKTEAKAFSKTLKDLVQIWLRVKKAAK